MSLSKEAAKRWANWAPLSVTALVIVLVVSVSDRLPSWDTAIAFALASLQWFWSHLQGGWLVAVLLLVALTQNAELASQVRRLRASVDELQERQDERESPYDPDDD